jgi:hypothetical protein
VRVNGNAIELGRTNIAAPLFRIQNGDVIASRSDLPLLDNFGRFTRGFIPSL